MNYHVQPSLAHSNAGRRFPRLATSGGTRVAALTDEGPVALGEPGVGEAPMTIEISGLTPEQQRAVLARFPGGSRFRLRHA